jgi:Peptidase family M23
MRLFAATVLVALMLSDVAGAAWHSPVPGSVTRPFDLGSDPFQAGRHRGVDLGASPGTTVGAACAGPVAFAGTAGSSGRVVTVLCGPWRVTHMPLASIAIRRGATVREGAPLGTVAGSHEHAGLHLGVRRDGTRFGYADPLRFLAPGRPTAPPLGPAPRPTRPPRPTPPRPPAPRPPAPRPAPAPRPVAAPPGTVVPPRPVAAPHSTLGPPRPVAAPPAAAGSNRGHGPPFAPWPAWLGLAFVLAGAGIRVRARSRRAPEPVAAAVR